MGDYFGQPPIAAVAEDLAQVADLMFQQVQQVDPATEDPNQHPSVAVRELNPNPEETAPENLDKTVAMEIDADIDNKSEELKEGAASVVPGAADVATEVAIGAPGELNTASKGDVTMLDAQQAQHGGEAATNAGAVAGGSNLNNSENALDLKVEGDTEVNETDEVVFVNLVERKDIAGGKPPKSHRGGSPHGHNYVIRFFLVDSKGQHHLAAAGIDNGDSHYEYTNQTGFPALFCHNKLEVKKWADGIIHRSQDRAGFHTDVICDEVPPAGIAVALPKFISYSESKEELPDGRHLLKWFLLDDKGHHHLAVTGEEKETRDGHYSYHTEAIFELTAPLEAKNQDEVKKWLDKMVVKPPQVAPLPAAAVPVPVGPMALRTAGQRISRPVQNIRLGSLHSVGPRSRYNTSGSGGRRGRGRGRGPGRPPRPSFGFGSGPASGLAAQYGTDSLPRQGAATGNLVRRGRGGWKYVDPDKDARDLIAAELKRWVQEESTKREIMKTEALAYSKDDLTTADVAVVERVLPTLQAAAKDLAKVLPPEGMPGTQEQRKALVATIGALREISHLRASLALLTYPDLKPSVVVLSKQRAQPDVASLAASTLEGWLRTAVAHISVLAEPRYVQDPRPILDNLVADQSRFDAVVTAITHRTLKRPNSGGTLGFLSPGSNGTLTPGAQGTPATSAGGGEGDGDGDGDLPGPSGGGGAAVHALPAGDDSLAWEAGTSIGVEAMAEDIQGGADTQDEVAAKKQRTLENCPSVALLDNTGGAVVDDDARILPPFEQHLSQKGFEF